MVRAGLGETHPNLLTFMHTNYWTQVSVNRLEVGRISFYQCTLIGPNRGHAAGQNLHLSLGGQQVNFHIRLESLLYSSWRQCILRRDIRLRCRVPSW